MLGEPAKPSHQTLNISRRMIETEAQPQPRAPHVSHDPCCVQTLVPLRGLRVFEGEEIATRRFAQRNNQALGCERPHHVVRHCGHELRLQRDGMGVCEGGIDDFGRQPFEHGA